MVCPNKNDPSWKKLVETHGEAIALLMFNAEEQPVDFNREIYNEIRKRVLADPDYYKDKYSSFLGSNDLTPLQMVEVFYSRFDGMSAKIKDDYISVVDSNGGTKNMLLFPEVDRYMLQKISAPSKLEDVLIKLQNKFNIPFVVVNEPNQKFKGRYVNQGEKKVIVLNTAYATEDTPFHEYYHPFVRIMKGSSPKTFEEIYNLGKRDSLDNRDPEEVVTDFLGKTAAKGRWNMHLQYFLAVVKKFLGLKNDLSARSKLIDIFKVLDEGVDLANESSLTSAYQKAKETEDLIGQKLGTTQTPYVNYVEILQKQNKNIHTNDNSMYYMDENNNNVAKRLTGFIGDRLFGEFSKRFRKYNQSREEYAAKMVFKQYNIDVTEKDPASITETVKIGDKEYTFEEILEQKRKEYRQEALRGKLVHSYLQWLFESDKARKTKAFDDAMQYAKEIGEDFKTLPSHPYLYNIGVKIDKIIEKSGIVVDLDGKSGIPKSALDKRAPEVFLTSNILTDKDGMALGSTADGLFLHANGEVTLLDWKTGNIAKDMNTSYLMDYGKAFDINDSSLSRAYLELTFRAIMLKEKFPDMRFRSIKIVKLDRYGNPHAMELDMQPYLYTVGEYYKQNFPDKFKELTEKKLLLASSYQGVGDSIINLQDKLSGKSREEQIYYLEAKLTSLYMNNTREEVARNPGLLEASRQYTHALLEAKRPSGVDLKMKTPDLNSLWSFKNFSDVANPKVQVLHKELMDAKLQVTTELQEIEKEHNALFENLVSETAKVKTKWADISLGATFFIGVVTLNPVLAIGSLVSQRLINRAVNAKTKAYYGFMWRESTDPSKPGYYMNTQDTYIKNGVEVPLTKAQQEYRSFVYRTMQLEYTKFANTVVGVNESTGDEVLRWQRLGLPQTLPQDFMPRIPKPIEEIREEENLSEGVYGLKTNVGLSLKRNLTSFLEDNYEEADQLGIPLRYFKHSGSDVVKSENHSWDAQASFKFFIHSLKTKAALDPVYSLALGVQNALDEELDEGKNKKYDNLVKWLDSEINMQMLGKQKSIQVKTKGWKFTAGKMTKKLTGIEEGTDLIISQDRLLRALKSSVTFSTMGFKVWSPLRNALLISAQNTTQTTRAAINKMLSSIVGVPPESFENVNLGGAKESYVEYLKAKLTGKEDESKLWALAKRFDWLPDNYPYQVNNNSILHKSIKLSSNSNAFMFYQLGENLGALWHLAGVMKSVKIQDKDGKTVSLWDAYDDKGNWVLGTRGYIENADGSITELKELTSLEVKTLKRSYEKLNGSYRQEEKTAMEATVLGDFVMQFHKYFYQYLKVLFASPYKDITVGKYVMTGKRPDGMPVYQWHSEVMTGQYNVLVGSILAAASGKLKEYLSETEFGENTLKGHRARTLAAAVNTFVWWAMLTWAFTAFLDDDDEETYFAKEINRTILDLTRSANPKDLLENFAKPIVAVEKIRQAALSTITLGTEGVWGETTKDGWPKGLKGLLRVTPGASSALQLSQLLAKQKDDSYLFGMFSLD